MGAPRKTTKKSSEAEVSSRRMPSKNASTSAAPILQLLRKPTPALTPNDISVLQRTVGNRAVQQLLSPSHGRMPVAVQAKMENAFQSDFSTVRVHPDSPRVSEAGMRAVTEGNEIHFAPGAYRPTTEPGQQLLGHELAHVVQQRTGRVRSTGTIDGIAYNDNPTLEQEAHQSGTLAARGDHATVRGDGTGLNGGAPVQQHFWELTTLLSVATGLGISTIAIMGLIGTFGLVAVGYAVSSCMKRGAKKVSREELMAELQQQKDSDSDKTKDQGVGETLNTVAEEVEPTPLLTEAPKQIVEGTPLEAPATVDTTLDQVPKQTVLPTPLSVDAIPDMELTSVPKMGMDPVASMQSVPPQIDSIALEAEEKRKRDVLEVRQKGNALKLELGRLKGTVQGNKIKRYLEQVNTVLALGDDKLLTSRRILEQIGGAMGVFRDEKERIQSLELQKSKAIQLEIENKARLIWVKYKDYQEKMQQAVAKFPDLLGAQRTMTILMNSAKGFPDRSLPDFDRDEVEPAWNSFLHEQAQRQLGLDHQGGHRLFIFNTEVNDILGRQETITQRLGNPDGGRTSPFKKGVLHERLAEARVYNENIIYSWQNNNLYLHGVVMWHMDKDMKGSEKQTTDTIEDRGNTVGNFVEVRYNITSSKYEQI